MCLVSNPESTRKLYNKISNSNEGFIYGWKVLKVNRFTDMSSRIYNWLTSIVFHKIWTPGWCCSDSNIKKIGENSRYMKIEREISRGIHVYLKKPKASDYAHRYDAEQQRIVRVKCHAEYLIAASRNHAVFKKVFLEEKEYRKAMK